jgi:fructose-bisphosphate aldolase class I
VRSFRTCIDVNALALFAAFKPGNGLVPIVEPEILMKGNHTIARCKEVAYITSKSVFMGLAEHHVSLEQMLVKTGMIFAGGQCLQPAVVVVAKATLRCLRRAVLAAVPVSYSFRAGNVPPRQQSV